ncbi:family 16 glycoside hydrolase [Limnoglobus roseus]|uniref:Putative beta-jelly-roll-type glycoside hydrolase and serine/threonine-protein kinase PknB n=1 Tax=Limnoglobus roseus TaxID=2598579 RepID=A0A5C1A7U0_9BACT|nr:family 16 glycoside hydrolase [Limnoglobus roseus]QEL13238.1 putative beta-jelly-roll-type glycoside hydrolase and serine/threonine-protein kinase PknB [Limnoglobus roseus]
MAPVQVCPTDDVLRAWILGSCVTSVADIVGDHLLECPKCGAKLDGLAADDPMVANVRAANATNSVGGDPTLANEILRRMKQSAAGKTLPNAELAFLAPPHPEHPTDLGTLDRYRVVELLGQGGMGMVFRAVDSTLHRTVALKVILPKYAANEKLRVRFLEEARATVAVRSAHVAEVYDCGVANGAPFLTMELLDGVTLDKKPIPMATDAWRRIAYGIAKGLADAHRVSMIHRDLKPSNIHLGTDARTGRPTVKIIDFGLARPVDRQVEITKSGELLGTPAYMSPEQARSKPNIDHRTDLYSLGVILYQLATGKLPYAAARDGVFALIAELASPEAVPGVKLAAPALPPDLASLIDRLLAKNPAHRPANADEVMATLKASLTSSVATAPAGLSEPVVVAVPDPLSFADTSTDGTEPVISRRGGIPIPTRRPTRTSVTALKIDPAASGGGPEPERPKRKFLWPLAAVGLLALALFGVYAAGLFKVKTKDGVIELTDLAEDAEVLVDGEKVTVTWGPGKQKAEVRVKPGTHKVEVKKDGFEATGEEVTLTNGDRKVLTAHLERKAPAAVPELLVVFAKELVRNGDCREAALKGWKVISGKWYQSDPEKKPFFCAGDCKQGVLQQDVDVTEYAREIDAGRVVFEVSAMFSSFDADRSQLKLAFLDSTDATTGSGYDTGEHADRGKWVKHGGMIPAPAGTRTVRVILRSVLSPRPGNVQCSGYITDVSLKAMPKPSAAGPVPTLAAAPPGSPLRYFGYGILGDAANVGRVAGYTNFLVDASWRTPGGEAVLVAARQAKVPLLLDFQGTAPDHIEKLYATIDKYRDVVAGVSWGFAYFQGHTPEAVAAFGRAFKLKYPGLQFWLSLVEEPRGQEETRPVPPEVDGLQVVFHYVTAPDQFRTKVDRFLPGFIEKAKGRPVVLVWNAWDDKEPGIAPRTQPGTMTTAVEVAKKYKLAGVEFYHLGEEHGFHVQGLQTNPVLVTEIEAAAKELGFGGLPPSPSPAAVTPPVAPVAEFVPLYNGKDLTGWERVGNPAALWQVEDGVLVGSWPNPKDVGGGSTLITTKSNYRNFHLRVRAMKSELWSSRIFLLPSGKADGGGGRYRVWLGSPTDTPGVEVGRLDYDQGTPTLLLAAPKILPATWFTLEVKVLGNRVQVWVDGTLTADHTDPQMPAAGDRIKLHLSGGGTIRFQSVEVRELAESQADATPVPTPPAAEAKFVPLFNGQDLTGWETDGTGGTWSADAGALLFTGDADAKKWLLTRKQYGDFRVKFECQLGDTAAASFAFRAASGQAPRHPQYVDQKPGAYHLHLTLRGPQARGPWQTGTIIGQGKELVLMPPTTPAELKSGGIWNAVEVELVGQDVQVFVNQQLILKGSLNDLVTKGSSSEGLTRKLGQIGFEAKEGVKFRNIELREILPTTIAPPISGRGSSVPIAPPPPNPAPAPPEPVPAPSAPVVAKDDPFAVGTAWRGVKIIEKGDYAGGSGFYEMVIDKRTGGDFTGSVVDNGPNRNPAKVTGTVDGNKITWTEVPLGNTAHFTTVSGSHDAGMVTLTTKGTFGNRGNSGRAKLVRIRRPNDVVLDEFHSIFNGRGLMGWETHPAQKDGWKVTQFGHLVGGGSGTSHLYTTKEYGDVHVKVRAKVNAGGNSGVYVRSTYGPRIGVAGFPLGYEAQISSNLPAQTTGSLFAFGGAVTPSKIADFVRPDEWFDLDVVVKGNKVEIFVNGQESMSYTDAQVRPRTGRIALQLHDAKSQVDFALIAVKELKP